MTGVKVNNTNIVYETKTEAIREIVECWDQNGFGLNNVNAKEQLVAWLDTSHFIDRKEVILKAMDVAAKGWIRSNNRFVY